MSSEPTIIDQVQASPPRDPFVRAQPSDYFWVVLRPVYKARQLIHPERLVRIAITNQKVGKLELLRLEAKAENESPTPDANRVELLIDHGNQRLRFGPARVQIAPSRRGLGGFLLAWLIDWCHRSCPDYVVTPILFQDGGDADSREMREKLLRRAGFDIQDLDQGKLRAQVRRAGDLISSWDKQRVEPAEIGGLLQRLREQETETLKAQANCNTLKAQIEQLRRHDIGSRFAIGCLITLAIFQAVLLLWVVLR